MKKLISFLLVIMMLCSMSTVAFAADSNASIDAYSVTQYKNTGNSTSINTPKTELWLQVDATGQIDVTVPLVLVFKTDIDGGTAQRADNYKFVNNSSSDLVVTAINTVHEAKAAGTNPMSIVAYTATPGEDEYKVQLSAKKDASAAAASTWDLRTTSHTETAKNGGLFELAKKASGATAGTDTVVTVDMATGKLSFVTSRTDADAMDTTMGVKLLTVTYTVAIDTSDAVGADITGDVDTKNQTFTAVANP